MNNALSRVLVLGTDELGARRCGFVFARTPLDMIQALEATASQIAIVVLAGQHANREDIAYFLREAYPDVVVHLDHASVDAGCAALSRVS